MPPASAASAAAAAPNASARGRLPPRNRLRVGISGSRGRRNGGRPQAQGLSMPESPRQGNQAANCRAAPGLLQGRACCRSSQRSGGAGRAAARTGSLNQPCGQPSAQASVQGVGRPARQELRQWFSPFSRGFCFIQEGVPSASMGRLRTTRSRMGALPVASPCRSDAISTS